MSQFNPYQDNGGTALAIAGENYVLITSDTRCSAGYSILSRTKSKIVQLTDKCCLVSAGQRSEIDALQCQMQLIVKEYIEQHQKVPSIKVLSQRLSVLLYSRRFFPFYTFNMLAGLNENNKGVVYSYDAVGNTETTEYGAVGSGSSLVLSSLDMMLKKNESSDMKENEIFKDSSLAQKLSIDLITAVTERDIKTGDYAETVIVCQKGIEKSIANLKHD